MKRKMIGTDVLHEMILLCAVYKKHLECLNHELRMKIKEGESLTTVAHMLMRIQECMEEIQRVKSNHDQ